VLSRKLRETLSEALLLNYSKSMFMANISHELRNPLSAIIGYASLIRDRQVDQRDTIEYATEICTAGEELLTLIGDILSLSSLEISGEYVKTVEFDLTDTARTGRRLLQEQAAAKNLRLLPISQTEPIRVKGDPTHTKKALLNVLSNAVKYTSMGEIEISVESNDDGEAVISVRDTGVGMSAEQIEKANEGMGSFERAYSLHHDGGGLGFPLTFLLMERQGGRLEIESEKGIGTTVRLIFPESAVVETKGDFI
jgi:signal transduction histidine kinase